MKFKVERNFIVRSEETIELHPEDFLYCCTIEELNSEIESKLEDCCEHPTVKGFTGSEEIGIRFWDNWFAEKGDKSFYEEWQKLKGLPQIL